MASAAENLPPVFDQPLSCNRSFPDFSESPS
jgi:hypothetical protein